MEDLPWWEYLIIAISAFFVLLSLNYFAKIFNDGRIAKRLATLEEKALRNHATQITTPINTISIAKPVLIETRAMGQLFSTGNRSRANSVTNTPYIHPIAPSRALPNPQPQSDTTIIIPLHENHNQADLEKQQSQQSNQEPIISNLGRIYKDELPAFGIDESNEDIEDKSSIPDNLNTGEVSEISVTLDQLGSNQLIPCDQMENNIMFPDGLVVSGVKMNVSNAEPESIANMHRTESHSGIQAIDLITDIPDNITPQVGTKSVFDIVKDLAPDVFSKKNIVAITNSVHVSHDKISKHKNCTLGMMNNDTPDPGVEDETSVKEWVEEMIADSIISQDQVPANEF